MSIEMLLFVALGFALGYYVVAHFFVSGGAATWWTIYRNLGAGQVRTGGLLLIAAGGVLIYWVLRAGLKSEQSSSGSSSSSGGSSGGGASGSPSGSQAQADSGVHMAIDTTGNVTGTMGEVYQVNSTYGAASGQAQDDMNAYANAIGNVG